MDESYLYVKIVDVCTVERAKKGKIYPKHTTLITLSGSNDTVQMLKEAKAVETRYACIYSNEYDNEYLNLIISGLFPAFYHKFNSGINFQFGDFKYFEIPVHKTREAQDKYLQVIKSLNRVIDLEEEIIKKGKTFKKTALDRMFVQEEK